MDGSEMVRGYLAGFNSGELDIPACHDMQSVAFRHGWMNGRDDRTGSPRDRAQVLRARAELILANTAERAS